jgi:hypothetical protein
MNPMNVPTSQQYSPMGAPQQQGMASGGYSQGSQQQYGDCSGHETGMNQTSYSELQCVTILVAGLFVFGDTVQSLLII